MHPPAPLIAAVHQAMRGAKPPSSRPRRGAPTAAEVSVGMPWKRSLLAVCAVGWLIVLINPIDVYGWLGSTPWYGWWDSNVAMTGRPYEVQLEQVRPDGASARAGLRNGDRLDLRDQPSFADRYWILTQPPATRSLDLVVHRGDSTFRSSFKASTTYDSAFWTKSAARFFGVLAAFWFLACSTLIAIRRPDARDRMVPSV